MAENLIDQDLVKFSSKENIFTSLLRAFHEHQEGFVQYVRTNRGKILHILCHSPQIMIKAIYLDYHD